MQPRAKHLQDLKLLDHLYSSSQRVLVQLDVSLSCRNRFVPRKFCQHPDIDALVRQRGDERAPGAVGRGPIKPSSIVKLEHQLAQTVG